MSKPVFSHWVTSVDTLEGTGRCSSDAAVEAATVRHVMALGDRLGYPINTNAQPFWESRWHFIGRPYYKVWPLIADLLQRTKLDFSPEYLRPPFPVMTVLLPLGRSEFAAAMIRVVMVTAENRLTFMRDTAEEIPCLEFSLESEQAGQRRDSMEAHLNRLKQILKLAKEREQTNRPTVAVVSISFQGRGGQSPGPSRRRVDLFFASGETVEASLRDLRRESIDEAQESVVRCAISAIMFGNDQHELVAPDVDRELIKAKHPEGRSKASKAMAAAAVEREIAACVGWKIGSEIDLPRPIVERGEVRHGAGTELTAGHYRSGHMRMQPCGVGGKDRKLIFVAPTLVRSDLPIRQSHGYRIRGKETAL